jgi:hypothetical protein
MCHCLLAIELERRLARQRLRLKPRSVEHRNTNQGGEFLSLDPWAVSVTAPGGYTLIPQAPPGTHAQDFVPNGAINA